MMGFQLLALYSCVELGFIASPLNLENVSYGQISSLSSDLVWHKKQKQAEGTYHF